METLPNVLEVLAAELRDSIAALKALPASSRETLSAKLVHERIALEANPEVRDRVIAAIVYYSQHLKWPPLSELEASFAHDRLAEAVEFGRWLHTKVPQDRTRYSQAWIVWLLVEYWNFAGQARWVQRMTSIATQSEDNPLQ